MPPLSETSKIVGFVTRLPFDVAADAGPLIGIDRSTCQNGVDGCPQISACPRPAIARPAVIQLASVGKVVVRIEQKKVRSACRSVGLCDILCLVIQQRERKLPSHLGESLRRVIRVPFRVV